MLRRILVPLLLALYFAAPAMAQDWAAYIGEFADNGACLTVIQAKLWDTNGAAPAGDPQTGMWYYNTTDSTDRIWTGAAWQESDANTVIASNSTTHIAATTNPHATDVGNLGVGTKAELDAAVSDGDLVPQWQTDLYVDQTSGSDVTPGPWGYATIGGALAVSASGDVIRVNPATYTEDISIPVGVRVLGEWAILDGTAILEGDDTYLGLYSQFVSTGTTGLTLAGVNQTGTADIRYQLNAGTADGISVTDSASTLFYTGLLQTVVDGEGLSSGSNGGVYYDLDLGSITGTGTCVYASPSGDVTGYFGQCDDDGAGVCIFVEALGYVGLEMHRLDCNTAYEVEATAELEITADEIVGTETCTGTCDVMESWVVADHVADVTTNPHGVGIDDIGGGTKLELDTAISDGRTAPWWGKTWDVDITNGSDAFPLAYGYATIGAAAAVAQPGDVIQVAPGSYTESFVVGDFTVWGPGATLTGDGSPNITQVDGSEVRLHKLNVPAGQIGILQATAAAESWQYVETLNVGAGSFGIINTAADAIMCSHGNTCNVGAGGFCWGDVTTSDGHIDLDYDNCYGTGAAGFCIGTFGAGEVVGRLGHAVDRTGTLTLASVNGTGGTELIMAEVETTTGVVATATATAKVITNEWETTNSSNLAAGTEFWLYANEYSGAEVGAGTLHKVVGENIAEGASPIYDGANFTGIDADDVDLVTVPSGNLTGQTEADGALAVLDAKYLGGSVHVIDMAGATHDFQGGATDPITGLIPAASSGNLTDWSFLERSSSGIRAALTNSTGGDVITTLTLDLSSSIPLWGAPGYGLLMRVDPDEMDLNGENLVVILSDGDQTDDRSFVNFTRHAADHRLYNSIDRSGAGNTQNAVVAGWDSDAYIGLWRGLTEQQAAHFLVANPYTAVEPADIAIDHSIRIRGGKTTLTLQFTAKHTGDYDVTISELYIFAPRD